MPKQLDDYREARKNDGLSKYEPDLEAKKERYKLAREFLRALKEDAESSKPAPIIITRNEGRPRRGSSDAGPAYYVPQPPPSGVVEVERPNKPEPEPEPEPEPIQEPLPEPKKEDDEKKDDSPSAWKWLLLAPALGLAGKKLLKKAPTKQAQKAIEGIPERKLLPAPPRRFGNGGDEPPPPAPKPRGPKPNDNGGGGGHYEIEGNGGRGGGGEGPGGPDGPTGPTGPKPLPPGPNDTGGGGGARRGRGGDGPDGPDGSAGPKPLPPGPDDTGGGGGARRGGGGDDGGGGGGGSRGGGGGGPDDTGPWDDKGPSDLFRVYPDKRKVNDKAKYRPSSAKKPESDDDLSAAFDAYIKQKGDESRFASSELNKPVTTGKEAPKKDAIDEAFEAYIRQLREDLGRKPKGEIVRKGSPEPKKGGELDIRGKTRERRKGPEWSDKPTDTFKMGQQPKKIDDKLRYTPKSPESKGSAPETSKTREISKDKTPWSTEQPKNIFKVYKGNEPDEKLRYTPKDKPTSPEDLSKEAEAKKKVLEQPKPEPAPKEPLAIEGDPYLEELLKVANSLTDDELKALDEFEVFGGEKPSKLDTKDPEIQKILKREYQRDYRKKKYEERDKWRKENKERLEAERKEKSQKESEQRKKAQSASNRFRERLRKQKASLEDFLKYADDLTTQDVEDLSKLISFDDEGTMWFGEGGKKYPLYGEAKNKIYSILKKKKK